ncbi:MAG: hypothetical protein ACE10G_11705, partial [Gemmatimonadales bacterium]
WFSDALNFRWWLPATASALATNVRCLISRWEDWENPERLQWVEKGRSSGPGVATSAAPKSTVRPPVVKMGALTPCWTGRSSSALARLPAW